MERRGKKYKRELRENNPNPYHVSARDRRLPPHMDCQLCQSTLGIVRDSDFFLGGGSSSNAKLLVRDKEHHVPQISEDLGLLYNGKAFLRHIRKVQESTQTWFVVGMSYYPPTPGQCNCSTC